MGDCCRSLSVLLSIAVYFGSFETLFRVYFLCATHFFPTSFVWRQSLLLPSSLPSPRHPKNFRCQGNSGWSGFFKYQRWSLMCSALLISTHIHNIHCITPTLTFHCSKTFHPHTPFIYLSVLLFLMGVCFHFQFKYKTGDSSVEHIAFHTSVFVSVWLKSKGKLKAIHPSVDINKDFSTLFLSLFSGPCRRCVSWL